MSTPKEYEHYITDVKWHEYRTYKYEMTKKVIII